jgi:hypothetical protein
MKQTNLFRLCGLLFTALCVSVFLFNSCKKDDEKPKPKPEPEEQLDQYEPNNSITEAASVTFGAEVKAWLTNEEDVDFYKFTGNAPGKLDVLKISLSNESPDANFTITIYNEDKQEITQIPYAGSGVNLNYEMVANAAVFYVKVSGKGAGSYPANYTLTVKFANVADKFEPNDDITKATLFSLNTVETCNLLTGDVDFFKIQDLSKENVWDVYEVKLVNKTTDMSPAISFYDVNKTEIEELETIAGQGKDITKQFFMKSGADNAQYLKVYTLSPLVTMPAGYTLEVVKKNLNEASEPNDTYSTAQEITANGTYQGTIIKKMSNNLQDCDIDFIKVTVPAGKKFSYKVGGNNIKYDEYYPTYSSTGVPNIYSSDNDVDGWTMTWGASGSVAYYYFAFKATVDLSGWSIYVEFKD